MLVLSYEGALTKLVPTDINLITLNYKRTLFSIFSIFKIVWRFKPDILFSTLGHLNLLIALLKPFLPKKTFTVARESNIISVRNQDERYPRIFNYLFKTVYKRYPCIICQSQFMRDDLVKNFSIPEKKITVINNPVDFSLLPPVTEVAETGFSRLISIGQLRREKGYDRVIKALADPSLSFQYKIIGGGDSEKLQDLINSLGLAGRIQLKGAILNPFEDLSASDCLLMGSYYEGFPNVLLEANACGVPVIAFRGLGGHNEIIEQGVNGWFVDSPEEFCTLIRTKAYKKLDRKAISRKTKELYDLKKIIGQYEDTLLGNYNKWINDKGFTR
jgi:glycosyltransferase involved in cell wall biosynthesis